MNTKFLDYGKKNLRSFVNRLPEGWIYTFFQELGVDKVKNIWMIETGVNSRIVLVSASIRLDSPGNNPNLDIA